MAPPESLPLEPRPRRVVETAAALLIGSELLSGKIRDENLHPLTTTLRSLGIRLTRAAVLHDDVEALVRELRIAEAETDLVITSGGVGPTHDDVTVEALARAFGRELVEDAHIRRLLEDTYGERLTPSHLRMARVPDGTEVVSSPDVPWPTIVLGKVWVLPGVPQLFRMKLMALKERVIGPGTFHARAVYTLLDEGDLKVLLDRVVSDHPNVEVGSYPKWFDEHCKTKVTLDSRSEPALAHALRHLLELLPVGEPQRIE